jgi:hypothetical protein
LVDSTDLIVITSVAQTVVITLTLAVFIFQFRSQERSIRESAYQNVMGRYTDFVRMLIDKPELARLRSFTESLNLPPGSKVEKLSPEDEVIYSYILLAYGMFEEVFLLYKKKWIDKDTWDQWSAFLQRISKHPLFGRVHHSSSGTFDAQFEEYVANLMKGNE